MKKETAPEKGLSPLQKAYFLLEQYKEQLQQVRGQAQSAAPVAIIGMALKFPGAQSPAQWWQLLLGKTDLVGSFPENRQHDARRYLQATGRTGQPAWMPGAYLDAVDNFDYNFFGLKKQEAISLHPLQRLFLQVSWRALEDAGCLGTTASEKKIGVYAGISGETVFAQYLDILHAAGIPFTPTVLTGNTASIAASRISYFLNLRGPALTIDTACSSSLVAVHQACLALQKGDCEVALAGGGRIYLQPETGKYQVGFESPEGRTKPFDAAADGAGIGEGLAMVVLKPLDKAVQDGDRIYAVIKGSAINQDGTSAGITAPNMAAQTQVLRQAWQSAGINPATLGLVETHGTGTPLGDPVEFQALTDAFGSSAASNTCALGAVKSNTGHLFEAAGVAGLIKCALALQHQTIPATIHHHKPGNGIGFNNSPFYINTENINWPGGSPRRAGVSSFGISGTNAHVVLEEFLPVAAGASVTEGPQLFAVSAAGRSALLQLLRDTRQWLEQHPETPLAAFCASNNSGRGAWAWRFACIVHSREDLMHQLDEADKNISEVPRQYETGDGLLLACRQATGDARATLLQQMADEYRAGALYNWPALYSGSGLQKTALPPYPLQPERCWPALAEVAVDTAPATFHAIGPAIPAGASMEEILDKLRRMAAHDAELDPALITDDADFFNLGMDSLIILQFIQSIQRAFNLQLSMGQVYEQYSTLRKLAGFVMEHQPAAPVVTASPAAKPAVTAASLPANISYFVPYKEIVKKTDSQFSPAQTEHLNKLIHRINGKTAVSKRLTQDTRKELANNRNVAGFRPEVKEITYQVIANRAAGSRIYDADGNEYIDLTMGFGVNLLGYNPPFIQEALQRELLNGYPVGPMVHTAGEVARLICEMTGVERVAFYNSGTEAVMVALRLARAVTGRSKFVLFKGSYHGTFDGVLALGNALDPSRSVPMAPGISNQYVENVIVLDYGSPEALEIIKTHAHELAAVLVEPVQSRRPDLQPRAFLQQLREITETAGAALVFDEVITGFRIHPGGAQAYFDIRADLVTYGKVIGGGLPVGVVAGRAAFMDAVDGGMWQFGDGSAPEKLTTFVAGTFNQHPLTMQAALQMLTHLRQQGPQLQEHLNNRTAVLAGRLNQWFTAHQIPMSVVHFGSLFRFVLKGNWDLFYHHLFANGVYVWEGRNCFLSTAHTDDDIEAVYQAVIRSVEEMTTGGWVTPNYEAALVQVPMIEEQEQLYALAASAAGASVAFNENQVMEMHGPLQRLALEQAAELVVNRHQALRTIKAEKGNFIIARQVAVPVQYITAGELETRLRQEQMTLTAFTSLLAAQPFNLHNGPFVRFVLIEITPLHHKLLMVSHHLVADGWTVELLWREISQAYSALAKQQTPQLPQAQTLAAYNQWVNDAGQSDRGENSRRFWINEMRNNYPALQLPADSLAPAATTGGKPGSSFSMLIDEGLKQKLVALAQQEKTTLFNLLLAGYSILLSRLSGQHQFVMGIPASGQFAMGAHCLAGQCVNMLPFYTSVNGNSTVSEYLQHLRSRLTAIIENQHCQLGRLLAADNSLTPPPIATEIDMNSVKSQLRFEGLDTALSFPQVSYVKYDLSVSIIEMEQRLTADFYYNTALFKTATVENWAKGYIQLLEEITAGHGRRISELSLVKAGAPPAFSAWNSL